MKIQRALLACDDKRGYRNLWPTAAKFWRRLGIEPTLIYVDNGRARPPSSRHGDVHVIPALADIPTASQASMARYWACALYPDEVVTPSDIDLMPLSRSYFIDRLADIDDQRYVHVDIREGLQPRASERTFFTACYHIARGDVMREMLRIPEDWPTLMREADALWFEKLGGRKPSIYSGYERFQTDELFLAQRLNEHADRSRFHFLHDYELPKRKNSTDASIGIHIHRHHWHYNTALLREGYYADAHCLRRDNPLNFIPPMLIQLLWRERPPPRWHLRYMEYRGRLRERLANIRKAIRRR